MQGDAKTYLRVGIFVTVALAIAGTLVFIIGSQSRVFQSKNTYYAVFHDVQGLREGSPVRIGGVSVGSVATVEFTDDGKVRTEIEIVSSDSQFVREGSKATVGSKGLLGDKIVDVTVGDGKPLESGATIPTTQPKGLTDYMEAAGHILADAQTTMQNLRKASEPFGEPEFAQSIRETSHNMAQVTGMAAEGEGTIHRLLADPGLAKEVDDLVENMRVASAELARTSRSVRSIADEVESGDGTAHEVIYGQEGKRMVKNFADAAGEVASLLGQVRQGEGTMHDLVYGQKGNELLANLTEASEDIKAITSDIRQGKGTLGALIEDPSVYEDVKRLIGDLQRNEILRALVRYSIKRDETVQAPDVDPVQD